MPKTLPRTLKVVMIEDDPALCEGWQEIFELIRRAREKHSGIPAILLTGSRDAGVLAAAEKLEDCRIIHKPVNIEEIENYLLEKFAS